MFVLLLQKRFFLVVLLRFFGENPAEGDNDPI